VVVVVVVEYKVYPCGDKKFCFECMLLLCDNDDIDKLRSIFYS